LEALEEDTRISEVWKLVCVTGAGAFTGAYSIFATTFVLPILGIVYFEGVLPRNYKVALNTVTLAGSVFGQLGSGYLADRKGRRHFYGRESIIMLMATLGTVMSSNGVDGSMSMIGWLLFWRFVLGVGIGADASVSAVICAE
jgi:PHS family inorganic phosphate transporter-like MFS transporter